MARTVYVTTELTGGGNALDGIDGINLTKGNVAFYINKDSTGQAGTMGNYCGIYMATTKNAADDVPEIINPDANPGDWNWEKLQPLMTVYHTTGKTAMLPNYGVSVIRTTAPSVHQLRRPRRGSYKKLVFCSTHLIKIRLTTAAAADLATPTVRFGSTMAGGSTSCVVLFSSRQVWTGATFKVPVQLELVGRTTARWEIMNITKNALKFSSST